MIGRRGCACCSTRPIALSASRSYSTHRSLRVTLVLDPSLSPRHARTRPIALSASRSCSTHRSLRVTLVLALHSSSLASHSCFSTKHMYLRRLTTRTRSSLECTKYQESASGTLVRTREGSLARIQGLLRRTILSLYPIGMDCLALWEKIQPSCLSMKCGMIYKYFRCVHK